MATTAQKAIVTAAAILITGIAVGCGFIQTEAPAGVAASMTAGGPKTLENLQTAFNGESNANAKYLAFAKKADEEGYTKVASLFRAAARAEEIHFENHAVVIKAMGGTPKADIKAPEIRSTPENLKAAIEGETYERDTMYPAFLAEARTAGNRDALRTFNFAKAAEAEHAKLYADALANIEKWRGGTTTFFVCPSCGFTTADPNIEKCPVDFTAKEKFEAVS